MKAFLDTLDGYVCTLRRRRSAHAREISETRATKQEMRDAGKKNSGTRVIKWNAVDPTMCMRSFPFGNAIVNAMQFDEDTSVTSFKKTFVAKVIYKIYLKKKTVKIEGKIWEQ